MTKGRRSGSRSQVSNWASVIDITLALRRVDIKSVEGSNVERVRNWLGEVKVYGVLATIVGTVYLCAWAEQMDGETKRIRYWPALVKDTGGERAVAEARDGVDE